MNFQELEHIVRAAKDLTGENEFIAIGSQSLLISVPDLPRTLRVSQELDIAPLATHADPQAAALIDGNIGEASPFHETFRVYAHGVGPETATLPHGWESRLRRASTEGMNGAVIYGLSPEDLAYSKLAAGREKDRDFVSQMFHHKIVRQIDVARLIGSCDDVNLKTLLDERMNVAVRLAQQSVSPRKTSGLSDAVRRAIHGIDPPAPGDGGGRKK
jgi:hypothetical protein